MRTRVVIFMGPQRIHRVPMKQASPTLPAKPRRLPPIGSAQMRWDAASVM